MIEHRTELGDDPYVAATTVTSFRIIEALNRYDGVTVGELVDELGLATGTVYKHLNTLQELHYVTKRNDEYHLGLGFLELGMTARSQIDLYDRTVDRLADVAEATGGVTSLMVPEHGYGVYVGQVVPEGVDDSPHGEGERVYLHATAGGKAILSCWDDDTVATWIEEHGLPAVTDATITEPSQLRDELQSVRDRHASRSRGEQFDGWHAVAVPITGGDGQVLGAISVKKHVDTPRAGVDLTEAQNLLGSMSSAIESRLWAK